MNALEILYKWAKEESRSLSERHGMVSISFQDQRESFARLSKLIEDEKERGRPCVVTPLCAAIFKTILKHNLAEINAAQAIEKAKLATED